MKMSYLGVLTRIQKSGEIKSDLDLDALADGMVSIIQGGLLLAKIHQSVAPMRNSIAQWISYLRVLK
jgi:hypothetical protein